MAVDPQYIEVIDWLDHCSTPNNLWTPVTGYNNRPQGCRSVGWVVKEDAIALTIVSSGPLSKKDDPDYCGDLTILKAAITRRKKIKLT